MKTLNLHVDYIKFKPLKKALKSIADLPEKEKQEHEVKEALVVLTAVEKSDTDVDKIVEKYIENIKDIAKQVNAKNIVLYPYAHLSKELGSPQIAQEILIKAEEELKKLKLQNTKLKMTIVLNTQYYLLKNCLTKIIILRTLGI